MRPSLIPILMPGSVEPTLQEIAAEYDAPHFLFDQPENFALQWQDSGQTTPVTAVNDPVGYYESRDPDTNDASQSTDARRPSVQAGYHAFDGSADYWATGLVPASAMTIAACFRASSLAIAHVISSMAASSGRCILSLDTNGFLTAAWGTSALAVVDDESVVGSDVVALIRGQGGQCELFKNGVSIGVSSSGLGDPNTTFGFNIGARNQAGTPSLYFPGRILRAFAIQAYVNDADARLIQKQLGKGAVSI